MCRRINYFFLLSLFLSQRKSLRDQWLMEGPPTSPDSTGPRSPLWGANAQEIETHINKLQVTSEQLAEEELKLKQLIEDGSSQTGTDAQTQHKGEAVVEPVGAAIAEADPNGPIMENGKEENKDDSVQAENHDGEEAGTITGAKTETDTTPPLNGNALNGNVEGESSHNSPEEDEHASANDFNSHPAEGLGAGGVTMTFLGFKEAEPGQGVDEDDDGGAIIRAERVIITDEGEEIPEEDDKTSQEPTVDATNEDISGNTEENGAEEKTENHPEATADPEQAEVIEDPPAEEIPTDVAVEGETQDLEQEEKDPQNVTVDGTIEAAQVPVYSTAQPSPTIRPKVEANTTESQTPKDEEVKPTMRISLSQFQEVPLDGAGETVELNAKAETEKQRAEQEPLLVSKAAAQLDTSAANRAEDAGAPKQKTCQCCLIM
ncbi:paralemmin-3 [Sinocyclocheilus grahami]|uniref:paralemmin-3 n=1 Tax=Sinocyclocheilus grahami TaxID=75366 RepID=UPI0007ACF806|nr:PREDICTED: paralemmin-3-like [Sinocyclocheilus grahami]